MDSNHYLFQDPMMPSRSGDQHAEDARQWSHDVISGDIQWQQAYRVRMDENYNIQHPIHHQLQQPMVSPGVISRVPSTVQPGYHPMHSIRCPPFDNPRALAPYQRLLGPGSMIPSMYEYSRVGYSHGQQPVLRQLHPSNEQLRSLPEMHQGMHHELQFEAPSSRVMEAVPASLMSRVVSASHSIPAANRTFELSKPSAFSSISTNLPTKRPNKGNSTTTAASPIKKFATVKDLRNRALETHRIENKINIPAISPEKENKSTFQTSISRGVRFVTASVYDVQRWRKNHVFSDSERCNLLIEIVGTVFDVGGIKPVKITVHSQCLINGVFWETDHRLDRNIILPGCLVKVVLRIPPDEKDFHFLKVIPLKNPSAAENAYRRIAYVTVSSIEQSKKR